MKRKYYGYAYDYQAILKDGTCFAIAHFTKKYAYVCDSDGNVIRKINRADIKEVICIV